MSRMPEVGDVVDDVFHIEDELDQGNFGVIFRACDRRDDRTMALKVHKPTPKNEEELRRRFEREARLIYSLDHPHVVEVLYYGETETELPYMAMEFLHGTDLKSCLAGGHAIEPLRIRRISLETLAALRAAHQIGIVHRDLKPGNIFMVGGDESGRVKVLDFGFAKSLDNQSGGDLTSSGTLVGSPAYMSPELVHKENVGPHSDLYSMGLIIAEMIAGDKIVDAESIYDTLLYQASDEPVELPDVVRESPFAPVVERAVQKEADDRYESAADMMDDLEAIQLESRHSNEGRAGTPRRSEIEPSPESRADAGASTDPEAETEPRSLGPASLGELQELDHTEREDSNGENREGGRSTPPTGASASGGTAREFDSRGDTQTPSTTDLDRTSNAGGESTDSETSRRSAAPQAMELILGIVLGLLGLGLVMVVAAYV